MHAASPDSAVVVTVRAKINLALRVIGRRSDGFHEIVTWMQPIELADELVLRPLDHEGTSSCGMESVRLNCTDPAVPRGESNLIVRAARRLAESLDGPPPCKVRIDLTKRIPIGGGLGGGSADAAAALLGLTRLWGLSRHDPRIETAAAAVGSDVPYFLGGGPAIARGRGTRIESTAAAFGGWIVLVAPPFGISTATAYANCQTRPMPSDEVAGWLAPWRGAAELSARLPNDLTAAAVVVEPALGELLTALRGPDQTRVHMTGSGSTLFALFDDADQAEAWMRRAQVAAPDARVLLTRGCTAPPCAVATVAGESI